MKTMEFLKMIFLQLDLTWKRKVYYQDFLKNKNLNNAPNNTDIYKIIVNQYIIVCDSL